MKKLLRILLIILILVAGFFTAKHFFWSSTPQVSWTTGDVVLSAYGIAFRLPAWWLISLPPEKMGNGINFRVYTTYKDTKGYQVFANGSVSESNDTLETILRTYNISGLQDKETFSIDCDGVGPSACRGLYLNGKVYVMGLSTSSDQPMPTDRPSTFGVSNYQEVKDALVSFLSWLYFTWSSATIDLSNCVSYFDGCNNCSVKDGKIEACTKMYCETPRAPECLEEKTWADVSLPLPPEQMGEKETTIKISTNQWFLTDAYTSGSTKYIKIDYTEDWPQSPGWAPEIINNNPLIRIFEVANTATFEVYKNFSWEQSALLTDIARSEFTHWAKDSFYALNPNTDYPVYYGIGRTSIVDIQHDSQKVYKVIEQYRP